MDNETSASSENIFSRLRPYDVIWDPNDERIHVQNTSVPPFSAIALLNAYRSDGTAAMLGTGWFVGPRTLLTAAHVLFDRAVFGGNGRATSVAGWPGYNGEPNPVRAFQTSDIFVHPVYRDTQARDFDFAVCRLAGGQRVDMWFEMSVLLDAQLRNRPIRVAGYPHDKGGHRLYEAHGLIRHVEAQRLYHSVDATEGQSGAPMWFDDNGIAKAVGVHVHGTALSGPLGYAANLGARLSQTIRDWVVESM